jgi:demethoxyubiquinone hydroxylase (CLK1/Coq7/Cat5 family)
VTYAIEVRADELYPVYQEVLDQAKSKVNMKSIIVEEEGHLAEMITQLKEFSSNWEDHASVACQLETKLFNEWIESVGQSIN